MELVEQRDPELRRFVFRDDGRLQPTLIITINDQPVPRGQADATLINEGDVVTLIPPVAGG
jgi:molybdopterin converting factor small subunit